MPFVVISPTQTDAKSPVDDLLMDTIREDLDYLLSAIAAANALPFDFIYPGDIMDLPTSQFATSRRYNSNYGTLAPLGVAHRINGIRVAQTQTLTRSKLYLEVPAKSGSLVCDVRKYKPQNTPILGIIPIFTDSMSGLTSTLSSQSIQSISRATPTINTQTITLWKTAINVESIVSTWGPDAANYRLINLDTMPDSDWVVGDPITIAGTTSEDGAYTIAEVARGGGKNIVIAGVLIGSDQTTPAGTVQLNAWSYNFSNPVDPEFVVGEKFQASGHTSGGNNFTPGLGSPVIYATNQAGNNIIVKRASGVAQGAAAGTCNSIRWNINLSAPADPDDFAVGETASLYATAGTQTGCLISAINVGGNNVQLARYGIVVQGGVGGTIDSNRLIYPTNADASGTLVVGDCFMWSQAGIDGGYDDAFEITAINVLAGQNIVAYAGKNAHSYIASSDNIVATKRKVVFESDQSAIYSTSSRIEVVETRITPESDYSIRRSHDGLWDVVAVNFGGGANYNVVVDIKDAMIVFLSAGQLQPGGRIMMESKSIYSVKPRIDFTPALSVLSYGNFCTLTDNGTFNGEASLDDEDLIGFCVDELPTEIAFDAPTGLVLQLG